MRKSPGPAGGNDSADCKRRYATSAAFPTLSYLLSARCDHGKKIKLAFKSAYLGGTPTILASLMHDKKEQK